MSRPSLYHVHDDDSVYPGDSDVHGRAPRPRYREFERAEGAAYVAYTDAHVAAALSDARAIYRDDYRALSESDHYEFKVAARSHWIYASVPYLPTQRTMVLWWRRPRRRGRATDYAFPFRVDDQMVLLTRAQHTAAFVVRVTGFDQQRGRAATGWVSVELMYRFGGAPGYSLADMRRALAGG